MGSGEQLEGPLDALPGRKVFKRLVYGRQPGAIVPGGIRRKPMD